MDLTGEVQFCVWDGARPCPWEINHFMLPLATLAPLHGREVVAITEEVAAEVGLILPSDVRGLVRGLFIDQVDVHEAALGVVAGHTHAKGAGHIAERGIRVEVLDGNLVNLQGDMRRTRE